MTAKKILITGATGFLGKHLWQEIRKRGECGDILLLARSREKARTAGLPERNLLLGDLVHGDLPRQVLEDVGLVIHAAGVVAAPGRQGFRTGNLVATENLLRGLQSSHQGCRVLFLSSLSAAGPSTDGSTSALHPSECRPVSSYGESKRKAELLVLGSSGIQGLVLRPPVIYGSGDTATRLLFRQALAPIVPMPRPIPLSVLHVEDVVRAVFLAVDRFPTQAILPLDGPERTDTVDFLRRIAAACGRRIRGIRIPLPLAWGGAALNDFLSACLGRASLFNRDKMREIVASGWVADGGPASSKLGFRPSIGIEEGLGRVAREDGWL
jgi:nucleoside-diphosphate-sugar epimerase